jgi:hypothetical protein
VNGLLPVTFPISETHITMRVEDLDKNFAVRNVTETVKQLIIINMFFRDTNSGDGAYKMLAMYFPENAGFQYYYTYVYARRIHAHLFLLCTLLDRR